MDFATVFRDSRFILTEGAIVERLRNECALHLDEHINHAGLIYDAPEDLARLYGQYIEIARRYDIPIMLMTPTRRVNVETLQRSAYRDWNLIADSCAFLDGLRDEYQDFSNHILLAGLLGCKGNAYRAEDALGRADAYRFHKAQVDQFAGKNLDFLFAGIMPALTEAMGMAAAMAESAIPYIISFMVRKDGRLLDGTGIADAISQIDQEVNPQPVCYMSNCVHPLNLKLALRSEVNRNSPYLSRFLGLQANASPLSPEELDRCETLQQGNVDEMVREMKDLHDGFGIKILGGCCGTDDRFLEKLAESLARS